jgi:hypothetical protein
LSCARAAVTQAMERVRSMTRRSALRLLAPRCLRTCRSSAQSGRCWEALARGARRGGRRVRRGEDAVVVRSACVSDVTPEGVRERRGHSESGERGRERVRVRKLRRATIRLWRVCEVWTQWRGSGAALSKRGMHAASSNCCTSDGGRVSSDRFLTPPLTGCLHGASGSAAHRESVGARQRCSGRQHGA